MKAPETGYSQLCDLVCGRLQQLNLRNSEKVKARAWLRPPLRTDLVLEGVQLEPFFRIPLYLPIDEVADCYEQFLTRYVHKSDLRKEDPTDWLARGLFLTPKLAQAIFAKPPGFAYMRRPHLYATLAQFASLVAMNYPVQALEDTAETFSVTAGYTFGVRDGNCITNLLNGPETEPVKLPLGAVASQMFRGGPASRRSVGPHDVAAATVLRQAPDDAEAILEALGALYWLDYARSARAIRRVWEAPEAQPSTNAAVEEARRALELEDPLPALREIFVPQFMRINEFIRRFSNPYRRTKLPLAPKLKEKWSQAIDGLL